jgi:transposase
LPINWQGARRGEVLPWPERRRRWSWEEKAQIVAESLAPNAVASAIARRYGLHRNQLYAWRKELSQQTERAEAGGPAPLDFVPVVVTEERDVARASAIEIELSGARVRVSAGVDPTLLKNVLRTLKALG